jgi:imidazolonepropionase-like amidohydrolase
MSRRDLPTILASLLVAASATAGVGPSDFALRAGRVLTISGAEHAPGVVVVRDGRIAAVGGETTPVPDGLPTVEAGAGVVMPGFVEAHSTRGLDRQQELAADASFVRVSDGLNPVSLEVEDARRNGITTLLVAPGHGALLAGRTAIVHPQGISVDSMIVEQDAALKISLLPSRGTSRMGHLAKLRRILGDTRRFIDERAENAKRRGARQDDVPPEKEALVDLLEGRLRAFVYCPSAADVATAFALGREHGFHVTPILAPEAWRAAELVRTNNVRVVVEPDLETWERQPDGTYLHVNLPRVLHEAGVPFCLTTDPRELGAQHPWYQAARAVRAGVPRDVALAAVTQVPAATLGFGRRKGVIEPGADADLLLLSADPLSGRAFVDRAWVRGIEIYDRTKDLKLERLQRAGDEPPMMAPEADHGDPEGEAVEHLRARLEARADPERAERSIRWPLPPDGDAPGVEHGHVAAPAPGWREAPEGQPE